MRVWVSGDSNERACPIGGSSVMGMKIPLMKRSGILMKFMGIMILPTDSVGTEANIIPIAANATHESKIPRRKGMTATNENPNQVKPTIRGTTETPRPYRNPAIDLPRITDMRDIGALRYLSNVFIRRSSGITTGPTVEDAQKTV